jgi:isopenicillin N synthase-like dioxygenase
MILYRTPRAAEAIPLIDISTAADPAQRRALALRIRETCQDVGFFYVTGHGVEHALIDAQFAQARRFFALPEADKRATASADLHANIGYQPLASQALDEGSPPDLKEGFQIGFDPGPEHPYVKAGSAFLGRNCWPRDLPGFREQCQAYYAAMMDLSSRLLALVALSLELPEDFFAAHLQTPIAALRLLHYPPQPQAVVGNQIGAGAHTDWGLVTLLAQDEVGGLEVCNAAGEWIAAPPLPGTFVVNLGDLLQRWSNDLYLSNAHRVRNADPRRARYSVVFFQDGDPTSLVSCLPSCCSAERPPRHEPCRIGDYMQEKVRQTFGAALTN